jgi:GT2 family glycosyltransferase
MTAQYAPRITIILATYNWPRALELCLKSLGAQTDFGFDVIIADDGSTQETAALIQVLQPNLPIKITHLWQEDLGFRKSKILNLAITQASGDYLIFLDGDCIVQPDYVAQHRALAREGQLVTGSRILVSQALTERLCASNESAPYFKTKEVLHTQLLTLFELTKLRLSGHLSKLLPLFLKLPAHPFRNYPKHIWRRIKGCNMACWREDAQRIHGFDESFEGWGHEDADFVFRLEDGGVQRVGGSFATEVFHLWHPSQPSDRELINKNRVLARISKSGGRV